MTYTLYYAIGDKDAQVAQDGVKSLEEAQGIIIPMQQANRGEAEFWLLPAGSDDDIIFRTMNGISA